MSEHILLERVDFTSKVDLCSRHRIQGYPSIQICWKGNDVRNDHGHHDHESYYGNQDTDSLVKFMETLIGTHGLALENKSGNGIETMRRAAPVAGEHKIEGFVHDKESENEEL
ncbi:hypothetical protein Nepgr_018098 [Nepenthes gracilis]|uniref:Thioredoxin domain-containing protein n=1 Tax=Nepenthes gracilis TaxID=150966 RepID=A0AAD3XSS3_NEPGR|nr:hypothetical protein Nepgr_018098 [Nepenthes gracilis]